jgi:STE24 endopeptidase
MIDPGYFIALFIVVYLLQSGFSIIVELVNRRHLKRHSGHAPRVFEGYIDEDRLSKISNYYLENSRFGLIRKVINDIVLLAFILLGGLVWIDNIDIAQSDSFVFQGLEFFFLLMLLAAILGLPFDYYHNFVIEERHGFNKTTPKLWITDQVKGLLISIALMIIVVGPLLLAIKALPNSWWFWGFIIVALFELTISELYPILIAPLFNKFEPLSDQELAHKVEKLVKEAGLKPEGVFQMDAGKRSKHTNAYFTGLGKSKRIVLFDTLVESHSHNEILAVLAHEIGHYKLWHIPKSLFLSMVSSLVIFYLTFRVLQAPGFQEAFNFSSANLWVGLLILGLFWSRAFYFLRPFPMAMSRRFERHADRFALGLMGDPEPMTQALKRLAKDNLANLNPHPFTVWFNYSHPPLHTRIEALQADGNP